MQSAVYGINNRFDPIIASLEARRQAIADFINNEAVPFVQDIDVMLSKSRKIFTSLDNIDRFDMGHAYVGLRLYFASTTIATYCENVNADEDAAILNFERSLPTVVPDGVDEDTDTFVGADWRDTQAILIGLAASGYVPPAQDPVPITDRDGDGISDYIDIDGGDGTGLSPANSAPEPTTTTTAPAPSYQPPPSVTQQPGGMGNGGPGTQAYQDELNYSDGPGQNITNG